MRRRSVADSSRESGVDPRAARRYPHGTVVVPMRLICSSNAGFAPASCHIPAPDHQLLDRTSPATPEVAPVFGTPGRPQVVVVSGAPGDDAIFARSAGALSVSITALGFTPATPELPLLRQDLSVELGAVILTYGGVAGSEAVVAALVEAGVAPCHIVLADNPRFRRPRSESKCRSAPMTLSLPRNVGYGAAMNAAAKNLPECPLLLFLTSDARISAESIADLSAAAVRYPQFGAFGPVLRDGESGNVFSLGGVDSGCGPVYHRLTNHSTYREVSPCDWLDGACILTRSELFTASGRFDERFFLYYEDVEWCHRVRVRGAGIGVVMAAVASQTGGRHAHPGAYAYFQARNSLVYSYMAHGPSGSMRALSWIWRELLGYARVSLGAWRRGRRSARAEVTVVALARGVCHAAIGRRGPPPRARWSAHITGT